MATIKSAVQEVRDQLFLDRADGQFLNVITENLGLSRPNYGFSNDDIWRAVIRRLALDTKQIENVFRDLLDIIFGPQSTVATTLAQAAAIGEESLYLNDWMSVPQRGTLVLDEGGAAEEIVDYTFRDPRTGEVLLNSALVNDHLVPISPVYSFLAAPALATDTTIVLRNVVDFPASGFPYTILLDAGDPNEEVVQLTGPSNGTGDSFAFASPTVTLTDAGAAFTVSMIGSLIEIAGSTTPDNDGTFYVTDVPTSTTIEWSNLNAAAEAFTGTWIILSGLVVSALANNHDGPTVTPVTSGLTSVSPSNGVIIIGSSENFPAEGLVRVQEDGGTVFEDIVYLDNDLETERLQLLGQLQGSYTDAEVTLLNDGARVDLAQVQVKGVGWEIFLTEPRLVQIYIPETLDENRLQDATFLHGPILGSTPSTISGAHAAGDLVLTVADASTFPAEGIILLDSSEAIAYTKLTASTIMYANDVTGIPVGTLTLLVEDAASIYAHRFITQELALDLSGTPETVEWDSIDLVNNTITLTAVTASLHATGATVNLHNPGINELRLSRPLTGTYSGGEAAAVIENAYAATDLEDGRAFTATDHLYQGSYLWTILQRIAESAKSTLDGDVAGPTYLVVSQRGGRTALEVKDAALFLDPDFQKVQVGRGLAGRETIQINDITLMRDVSGVTVNGVATAGDLTLTVSGASGLPEAHGYRLFIDDNVSGTDEEVVIVTAFSGTTVTLESPLAYNHSVGDVVSLMADVLTVDALTYSHAGVIKSAETQYLVPLIGGDWASGTRDVVGAPNAKFALIEEVREYIEVTDASVFTASGGYVQINFGRSTNHYESQLTSDEAAASGTIIVDDGSGFPAANFYIHVGEGTSIIETIQCSSRTGNTLTLASNLLFNHRAGEWILYATGEQEQLAYTGTETGGANERLLFSSGVSLACDHLDDEPVALSSSQAVPSSLGTDFPFYIPSKWEDRLLFLIDLARAAGVRVVITSDR